MQRHTAVEVGPFSDDGMWWWDGTTWIATAQIVLPQLPLTEFEQSGKLQGARSFMRRWAWVISGNTSTGLAVILLLPWLSALRDYRAWKVEQLALATAHLLGPNESMVAGETSLLDSHVAEGLWAMDLAVVVTAGHILVFRIDSLDGQPRWVALAGRPADVEIKLRSLVFGLDPTLLISCASGKWLIRGIPTVFKPAPVLEAWQAAIARLGGLSKT